MSSTARSEQPRPGWHLCRSGRGAGLSTVDGAKQVPEAPPRPSLLGRRLAAGGDEGDDAVYLEPTPIGTPRGSVLELSIWSIDEGAGCGCGDGEPTDWC